MSLGKPFVTAGVSEFVDCVVTSQVRCEEPRFVGPSPPPTKVLTYNISLSLSAAAAHHDYLIAEQQLAPAHI